jgi:hypothetical protein
MVVCARPVSVGGDGEGEVLAEWNCARPSSAPSTDTGLLLGGSVPWYWVVGGSGRGKERERGSVSDEMDVAAGVVVVAVVVVGAVLAAESLLCGDSERCGTASSSAGVGDVVVGVAGVSSVMLLGPLSVSSSVSISSCASKYSEDAEESLSV